MSDIETGQKQRSGILASIQQFFCWFFRIKPSDPGSHLARQPPSVSHTSLEKRNGATMHRSPTTQDRHAAALTRRTESAETFSAQRKLEDDRRELAHQTTSFCSADEVMGHMCEHLAEMRKEKAFSPEMLQREMQRLQAIAKHAQNYRQGSGQEYPHLQAFIQRIEQEKESLDQNDEFVIPEQEFISTCRNLRQELTRALRADGFSRDEIRRINQYYLIDYQDSQKDLWQPFEEDIELHSPRNLEKTTDFKCSLTPYTDSDAKKAGKFGRTSNGRGKSGHLENRWVQRLTLGGQEAGGAAARPEGPLFACSRTACSRGNLKATQELVANALLASLSLEQIAEQKGTGSGTPRNPFTVRLANLQLMTPNRFAADKDLPILQMRALEALAQKESFEVEIPDPQNKGNFIKVFVKLEDPLLFDFGGNVLHFAMHAVPLGLGRRLFLTDADVENTKSMERLFGANFVARGNSAAQFQNLESLYGNHKSKPPEDIDFAKAAAFFPARSVVREFLQDEENAAQDRLVVFELAVQILQIWRSNAHNTNPANPYAIQSRLAVLTHRLGYTPSLNCKSGKDRTGMVCADASALAAEIEMTGHVPEPYPPQKGFNPVYRYNRNALLSISGRPAMACTGFGGLKNQTSALASGFNPSAIFGNVQGASALASS